MEKYKNSELTAKERAADLLKRMTLEEKVAQMDMVMGTDLATEACDEDFSSIKETSDFHWDKVEELIGKKGVGFVACLYSAPGVLNKLQKYFVKKTRLGIPAIFSGESLHGSFYGKATIFPVPLAMGATFNPELIHEIGRVIGAENRSVGIHEILAPNLDIAREPRWGRVEETFGEDTYLSSRMAYEIITGEQGDRASAEDAIICEPKHYCVHGIPESGRNCFPARVGQREVETTYLPVFEAGIKDAGAYNAMASYNSIDGEMVISSKHYLTEILKERYDLKGYIRADFGAVNRLKGTHHVSRDDRESIEMAVNAGLDVQGFDFSSDVWQNNLIELVKEGKIPIERIDDAVSRVLRVKFELGLFENPYTDENRYQSVVRCDKHKAVAYAAAKESVVLLKNKNDILPLSKKIESVAVIGPGAVTQRIGSYSAVPQGYSISSVYDEIKKKVEVGVKVTNCTGCGITEYEGTEVPASWYIDGASLEYYPNQEFSGEPARGKAAVVNFNWVLLKPHHTLGFNGYSVRIRTKIKVNTHDFSNKDSFNGKFVFLTDNRLKFTVDGKVLIDNADERADIILGCEFNFVDGAEHEVLIEYVCDKFAQDLVWRLDYRENEIETAVEVARQSDVTVLVCGDNRMTSGEGWGDRCDLKLFGKQRELIKEISELGKPLVLVLETGRPIDLTAEIDEADAILEAWFGGEFGAKAIADVLFGDANPSGRLPITFPKNVGQLPCYYSMMPGGITYYAEEKFDSRFEFGFGLSYTKFEYANLHIQKEEKTYLYTVTADVTNTGEVEGEEVVQLYLEDMYSSVVTPEKLLKGFRKISLLPGETGKAVFELNYDSFKLLNKEMEWTVEPGEFRIMLGASSKDIRLEKVIEIS